jgi:hypothetical protein
MPTRPTTVNSHWQHKKTIGEITVTRVTFPQVPYITIDKSLSGCMSQLVFLQDFQPVTELGDSTSLLHSYFGPCTRNTQQPVFSA